MSKQQAFIFAWIRDDQSTDLSQGLNVSSLKLTLHYPVMGH